MNNKFLKIIYSFLLYGFAIVGVVFTGVFVAMRLHLTDVSGSIDSRNSFYSQVKDTASRINFAQDKINYKENGVWMDSPEWISLKEGIIKDKDLIDKVSIETGVPARLIISSIIPEQLRFFTSNRESFKKYFEPLKILGTYTQFSYGISGIKMETATAVENNLKDRTSPFYLGASYENILDYQNVIDLDAQRLDRFTDSHDHYYSYLYTAIYLKEIMAEWQNAGYPINDRPEVLATLFNLGFNKSVPKDNPDVGGSVITINNTDYTFGGLSYDFYYSAELSDIFPIVVQ